MDAIVTITSKKKRTLYVASHPVSRRERPKFTPRRSKAIVLSGAVAKNIRDSLLLSNAKVHWV